MNYEAYESINPSKYFKKKRELLIRRALSKLAKPITLQALKALQVDGYLSKQVFDDNIGKIFPLVLLMVSQGHSISYIENFLGMRTTALAKFIQVNPRLKKACNEARKVKSDRSSLDAIELEFILS